MIRENYSIFSIFDVLYITHFFPNHLYLISEILYKISNYIYKKIAYDIRGEILEILDICDSRFWYIIEYFVTNFINNFAKISKVISQVFFEIYYSNYELKNETYLSDYTNFFHEARKGQI